MTRPLALALLITLSLAACRKEAAPSADAAATPSANAATATATAAPAGPAAEVAPAASGLSVDEVDIGLTAGDDNKLVARGTSFKPSDTVLAAVVVRNASATPVSAEITARWQGPDGNTVSEESQAYQFSGETTLNFRIANPAGFPKGNYLLRVLLNGKQAQTRDYSID